MTTFMRLLDTSVDEKAGVLRKTIASLGRADDERVFERDSEGFAQVPGSPFAYWAGDRIRMAFCTHPRFDQSHTAARGAYTTDDFKYYRLTWEVHESGRSHTRNETLNGKAYAALAKGGAFSPFYADVHLVIRWQDDGAEPKVFLSSYRERKGWGTDWSACLNGYSHYFRPGITWSLRTTSDLSLRIMPSGCIFTHKGPAAFDANDEPVQLLALCALMNSSTFRQLVGIQLAAADAAARSYEVGVIQQTPVPDLASDDVFELTRLARRAWSLRRSLDTTNETSHAFVLPEGLNQSVTGLDRASIDEELVAIQREIDERAFVFYGIGAEDRATIERAARNIIVSESSSGLDDPDEAPDEPTLAVPVLPLNSWLVGVAFGRFDPRLATRQRVVPPEPEPIDPLPSRSPGMWPADEPYAVPPPSTLVDDPGHSHDLTAQVEAAAAQAGSLVPIELRPWLARDFFPLHIKMYSKSRRKAPIYWQLATPTASYSVWLYLHAFTKDTLYRVQKDHVEPKLAHEERSLEARRREQAGGSKASERKALAAQETFVDELRGFLDEVKRVAPLWSPDLDDGVVINFAPLWRLVPQYKPWQKELKATWDALCGAEYEWSHLAMHLWPERVVPKCATDRSLAIAHGLEGDLWVEGTDGKWKPRTIPLRSVDEMIQERSSTAVKAALRSLLEAPVGQLAKGVSRARGTR